MKSVPTLCATATVVGASAVGLSFGRPEHSLDSSNKRKATPARVTDANPMPTVVHTSPSTTTAPPFSSPIPFSRSSCASGAPRPSLDGRHQQRKLLRRMTSGDAAMQSYDVMMNGYAPPSDREMDDLDGPLNISRRASWIKRLSAISTPQGSSRNSSPGPLSPSVSCSNGSMAFSHDGSTAPIIGNRPPSPLPPNKLVKRSSSVRMQQDSLPQISGSRLPSLRRPATSHQRSATLQRHSALMEMPIENLSAEEASVPLKGDDDVQYTQFFTAKVSSHHTLSKRRNGSGNTQAIKRIFPDGQHKPTLLLAKAVSAYAEEVDETSSEDDDSVFVVSRPSSPLDAPAVATPKGEDVPTRSRSSVDGAQEARPRRSFSISDFLSSGSNARKQRAASKLPGSKLTRKASHRATSAPLSAMGARESSTAHGEPSGLRGRRDLTDPILSRREISTSAGHSLRRDASNGTLPYSSSPASLPLHHRVRPLDGTATSSRQGQDKLAVSSPSQAPPSPTLNTTGGRPSRHSVAPSEQASTLVGSDNEARGVGSGDEDEADFQSETVFDSLRTGATRSTSGAGARGPRIETIFDESPPQSKVKTLRDLLPKGTFREPTLDGTTGNHSIAEEEESISTPVRTIVPDRGGTDTSSVSRATGIPPFPTLISSSPPHMPKPLSLGTLEWDRDEDDDSSRWSFEDQDEEDESWGYAPPPATQGATPVSLNRHIPHLGVGPGSSPKPWTPPQQAMDHGDRDARSSIFDWSEQQPTDKSSGNRTPPRPRTVHGKKDADRRGSRSVGRRVPSGLHARSQSVPVVPDVAGKRSTVVTNKFGTWGVGSKGVTEDWNDDFDFTDLSDAPVLNGSDETPKIDCSSAAMVVPKTIQEQQSNVLANIGLLREWGLLIEELKEQRFRADLLGILEGPNAGIWEEVDAMIDLADQEAEQNAFPPRLSAPSSPGFDEAAFDDVSGSSPTNGRGRPKSNPLASDETTNSPSQALSNGTRPRRKSILPPNHDIFGPQSPPLPSSAQRVPATTSTPILTRSRKDSEAKAQSIIEALQKRRSTHESIADLQLAPATEKVPFDTATLRRIVPYVSTLARRVKDTLREAEGLYHSPSTSPKDPPFSKIFHTDNDLAAQMKLMTVI